MIEFYRKSLWWAVCVITQWNYWRFLSLKLRRNIDAAEYKHIALVLIFLKCVSDALEVMHAMLLKGECNFAGTNPEDPMMLFALQGL
jgi:hypothetical protein